jgi:ribosomal protein S18 acetylase RimI-like enzyme
MQIAPAKPEEAVALTALTFAAKRSWGYPPALMREWQEVLTVTPAYIASHQVYTARRDDTIVGWCGFQIVAGSTTLEHLWVAPAAMNSGVGRVLFQHVEQLSLAASATRIVIESDPNAEGFYQRMGAKTIGQIASSVRGQTRLIPKMEKLLGSA